ncbi:MAG TPA: MFS transporter [Streptosporangiaceae bacterium]|nr:MFS transporter [Streptosporangiaceae bacterium]
MPWPGLLRRFPVLGVRDFRLLLADRLLAPASFAFSMVGVSFAVLDTTGSSTDLSYVLAAQLFPMLVFALVGGVVADRVPPQRVIVAANVLVAAGEGGFGILVLAGRAHLWEMVCLEVLTGAGISIFYPASQSLLPRLVPEHLVHEASALSRLVMNAALMGGAAVAGLFVAAAGPGWALVTCSVGTSGTVPLLLAIRAAGPARSERSSVLRDLRDGWSEFASRTWLWGVVAQYLVVVGAWYAGFQVLGPVVARRSLGGPAAWGAITAAESVGLILGGLVALHFHPKRPIRLVALAGFAFALPPLALAMGWPLPLVCVAALGEGSMLEISMVYWTVALARHIPPDRLAKVFSYDLIGSMMGGPVGALAAGPAAAALGVPATQYGAAVLVVVATLLALVPRDVRQLRGTQPLTPAEAAAAAVAGPSLP